MTEEDRTLGGIKQGEPTPLDAIAEISADRDSTEDGLLPSPGGLSTDVLPAV